MNSLLPLILIFFCMIGSGLLARIDAALSAFSALRLEGTTGERKAWLEDAKARGRARAAAQSGMALLALGSGAAAWAWAQAVFWPWWAAASEGAGLPAVMRAAGIVLFCGCFGWLYLFAAVEGPRRLSPESLEKFTLAAVPLMRVLASMAGRSYPALASGDLLAAREIPSHVEFPAAASASAANEQTSAPEEMMLSAVRDFSNLVVRQVSVPRTEVVSIEAGKPAEELIRLCIDNGLTKIPVYESDLDHIVGIVHLRDLVLELESGSLEGKLARELAREALFVPETIAVTDLLRQFRDKRVHIAIVLDEFGGTAGLVTLEDLLEEIIGDVQDEFEDEDVDIVLLENGSALIDGMTFIEDVNDFFKISLYDPDYDTIAGYILGKLGRIAQEGDIVIDREQHIQLRVEKMDRRRIAQICLKRL